MGEEFKGSQRRQGKLNYLFYAFSSNVDLFDQMIIQAMCMRKRKAKQIVFSIEILVLFYLLSNVLNLN